MPYTLQLAFLLLLLMAPRLAAQPAWDQVTIPAALSSGSYEIVVTIDAAGVVHACGSTGTGTGPTWYSNNAGGSFREATIIADADQHDLAADSLGNIYYVGASGNAPGCLTFAEGFGALSDTARKIDPLCSASVKEVSPTLASEADGRLHLAYVVDGRIYYRERGPTGIWSPAILLSADLTSCMAPSIGVADDGTVHIAFTTSTSLNGPATVLYVTGRSGAFAPPLPLWTNAINLNSFGAQVVVDHDNRCHIFFAMSWARSVVMHMEKVNGAWSEPDTAATLDPANELLINIQAAVAGDNTLHLAVAFWDRTIDPSVLLQNVNHVSGKGRDWCRRRAIPTSNKYRFPPRGTIFGVRYLAVRDSLIALACLQMDEAWTGEATLFSTLLPTAPCLLDPPDTLDFGELVVGRCSDTTIPLTSSGSPSRARLLLTSMLSSVDADSSFIIELPDTIAIADRESHSLGVRFCALDTGEFIARLLLDDGFCSSVILLKGEGKRPLSRIWLDTASIRVGDRAALQLRISPPLEAREEVDSFAVVIRLDPDALFPRLVTTTIAGTTVTMSSTNDGEIVVQGWADAGREIVGERLATIELEGLMTGRPRNPVVIEQAELAGAGRRWTTDDGLVLLEGCDLGSSSMFGRAVRIHSVRASADRRGIVLHYSAPAGYEARVRLLNLLGVCEREVTLPVSTEGEHSMQIPLDGVPFGAHVLELVGGAGRTTTLFLVGS